MSPRNWKERITDILKAITEIQTFIAGMDFETFLKDEKTIRAALMNSCVV